MGVEKIEIINRFTYADGKIFRNNKSYEQIDALVTFCIDPKASLNESIVDINLIPTDTDGKFRFTSDFSIVKPVSNNPGDEKILLELPNRGRRKVVDTFNRTHEEPSHSPGPGDGFLFNHGFTIASIGWQWDVYHNDVLMGLESPNADLSKEKYRGKNVVEIRPNKTSNTWLLADRVHKPLRADLSDESAKLYVKNFEDDVDVLIPRSNWKFAKEIKNNIVESNEHIYLRDGFVKGKIYQIVYKTLDSPVAGLGLLALRDIGSYLKNITEGNNLELEKPKYLYGYGVSQTGRMLRHFTYLGLNIDQNNKKVFDGLIPHVAGGRMGAFNHRFAQPSNQSYPSFGHLFPFSDGVVKDPLSGKKDGLLVKSKNQNCLPKIMFTNSSAEYWRGDCSLTHIDILGEKDLDLDENIRIYLFSSTQHGAGVLPQSNSTGAAEGAIGLYGFNVVDYAPLLRACLINLHLWVSKNTEPPKSQYPKLDDKTAVDRSVVMDKFSYIPNFKVLDNLKLWKIRTLFLGKYGDKGIGEYPPKEGAMYPCYVPDVDKNLNEIAGIRLPEIVYPIASHTGWNVRDPQTGATDQIVPMQGFSLWFDKNSNSEDPRDTINTKYSSKNDYKEKIYSESKKLADQRYILDEDIDLVTNNATERFEYLV